jgi:Iron-containing redox enzyme
MACGQGELLRRKLRFAAPLLVAGSARFWEHERLADLFPTFLLTIHGSVRATVPLMSAAVARLQSLAADPALRAPLVEYLERHAREEADHEAWLLDDLEVLGISRGEVLARAAPPAVAALVGAQYYWIHHAHPVALLGFFAVLEGHPPTLEHLDEIQRRTKLPSHAFRMLRSHAELDAAHANELFDLVDRLPLDRPHVELLGQSALYTMSALTGLFESLLVSDGGRQAVSTGRARTES